MAEQNVVDVVACPGCESANLPSSTVCGECGERLVPPTPFGPPALTPLPKCSCGGRGICTVCVLALYDDGAAIQMESALQHALLEKAGDVAALIGSIGDDYERAWAQELFEQEMNVRLYVISQQGEAAS